MTSPVAPGHFVHIADLHFWEIVWNPLRMLNKRFLGNANVILKRSHHFQMHRAEAFADAAAATGAKTAVLTGDFSCTALEGEFAAGVQFVRGLERRGMQVHLVPGNHDFYTYESVRRRRFERHFGPWLTEGSLPLLRTLPGGVPLLLVPTACPNLLTARGRISGAEAARVAGLLRAAPPGPAVVAGHYPYLHRTYGYASTPPRRLRNAAQLRATLGAAGRDILYLAGHVHRFSFVRDARHSNLLQLTTGGFFLHRPAEGYYGEFSEVRVGEAGIAIARHRFFDSWHVEIVQPQTAG